MKYLHEIGIVFRGTTLVNRHLKQIPNKKNIAPHKDLRGSFFSAINLFVSKTYTDDALEYLESGNFLFIFKISEIKTKDNPSKEPLIFYGLVEKKKKQDKQVKYFLKKVEPLIELFLKRYTNLDFTNELYRTVDFEFELYGI
ncbi:MAG: hypothetical protein EU529_13305 [Promethearchaeota archaeon]|nr:MAG: hypothetical protein EU529_13305 [Candidatus Lokiarchaeota archaeon]